jgi:hypothetical protein
MATMLGNLYAALIEAGASPDKAQAAAEEATRHEYDIADLKSDVRLLKWMVGLVIALNLAMFYKVWGF